MRSAAAALVLACLAIPAGAEAATRHVSPTGAGEGACERLAPCSVAWAVNGEGSAPGDTVVIGPGTYADQPLVIARELTVTAAPDAPRPVFRTTQGSGITVAEGAAGSLVEHLAVRAAGADAPAVSVGAAVTLRDLSITTSEAPCLRSAATGVRVEDSTLTATGPLAEACLETTGNDTSWTGVTATARNGETAASYSGNGTILDGTFTSQGVGLEVTGSPAVHRVTGAAGQRGITLSGSVRLTDSVAVSRAGGVAVFAGDGTHELLNVTAWGARPGAVGVRAVNGAQLEITNTIARGPAADLAAAPATTTFTEDCAAPRGCPAGQIVVDHSNFRTAPGVQVASGNQAGAVRFAAAGFEDFRLRRGSPAIDAGSFVFDSGSADRDGRFRWLGKSPDIGAYEFPSPRATRPKADAKRPTLGVVRLTATRFRVARRGAAFTAAGTPAGTTLIFVVSEKADLVAQVSRPGGRSIGTMVRPVRRGTNRLALSGRVDGRVLAPGRYVLKIIARDVSQNLSRARRLPFTVVGTARR